MAKTSKTKSIDKLTKLAEEYGVKGNPVIQELIEKYCSIQDLIEQMKVQIEKDGLTCTKVYSNGKENVYAHPLLDATKKFQDTSANILSQLSEAIVKFGSPPQKKNRLREMMAEDDG